MTSSIRTPRAARRLALALALPLLGACASGGTDTAAADWPWSGSCGEADWNALGVADALSGERSAEGLARIAACPALAGPARVEAEDDYLAGHDEGVARFCTYATGVELGRARRAPALTCPAPLAPGFEAGLAEGRSQPVRTESTEDALAAAGALTPRIRPWLSIGYGSRGWSGLSWGIGIGF
ncbi:MAG: DUF2799 domain-containing protein [Pseudomonadota bacterium]|nr:DUF2799 domain-containing protein [Pseudomonadota bacterium]